MGTISEVTGDLFDPDHGFDAIGHGVNCQGAMGAGIAKVFREKYPDMYEVYKKICSNDLLLPGGIMPWKVDDLWIYNIASQQYTGPDAKIDWLGLGLVRVKRHMMTAGALHLGLPRIGAGIGGLTYPDVYDTVCEVFDGSPVNVTIVSL